MSSRSVFVAGSRKISSLPAEVRNRIDTIIDKGFEILVGDANGADKAVQQYLAAQGYPKVVVYCMEDHCRNNVGHWPIRHVSSPPGTRGFDYYSLKDLAMAKAAEYGLMLWDGKSKGTINNVLNLSREKKLVVVYVAPAKSYQNVRSVLDLKRLLAKGDPAKVNQLSHQLHLDTLEQDIAL